MTEPSSPSRVFYGWIVLAAAAALVAVGTGITFSLAVFLRPLSDAFGWSRALIWSLHLASTLVGAAAVAVALALAPPRGLPALAGGR